MNVFDRLGLRWPIVQAPMAGAQGSALAIAVCEAGALGSLPAAMLALPALAEEIRALRAATRQPFNVNFFCHRPPEPDAAREAAWRAALAPYLAEWSVAPNTATGAPARLPFDADAAELMDALRPPVLSFHFGLPPADLLARVKSWGTVVMASATTVAEARWLEAQGADVVIAQGLEAGGHRGHFLEEGLDGQMGTFALLPQIRRAVRLPVLAAGGIADAAGVRAAQALGADGVQVGTAYLCCPEASTSALHRAALADAQQPPTALTNLFSGRPARGIVNRLMRELGPISPLAPAFPLAGAALAALRARAEAAGCSDFTPLWSGQNRSGCRTLPAAEITRALAEGWQ